MVEFFLMMNIQFSKNKNNNQPNIHDTNQLSA